MKSISDYPEILTMKEVSSILSVSEITIRRKIKNGELPVIQGVVNGHVRFLKSIIEELLN